jgi:hypothetical protein
MADGPIERNPESYRQESLRVGCNRYEPCQIDGKCRVKASHLFLQCQECRVPFDNHGEKQRGMMIRRENFEIKASQLAPETLDAFRELGKKFE